MITTLRSESNNQYSINEMVNLFGVSRSGYRHHISDPLTESRKRKMEIISEMKQINHDDNLKVYGSPRMTEELNDRGLPVSENTVAKWMSEQSLVAKGSKPFRPPKTTTPDPGASYSPNLIKSKEATRFGEILISDITYLRTREGWMYLAVVIDLYSRAVIGWQLDKRTPASLVTRALKEVVKSWSFDPSSAIFHSDRGSQYTSGKLRGLLADLGMTQSMSAKGNCYDNATCESFFAAFKRELLPDCGYFDHEFHCRASVFQHIEGFYNTRRRHSSLGMKSPIEFIKQNENKNAVAA